MFYEIQAKTHVRVPPNLLADETKDAVFKKLGESFEGHISSEVGFIVAVTEVLAIGEGIIIPGDGAAFYDTTFKFLAYLPEMQEVVLGKISDITNFGAFLNMGAVDGMIHVSQTMDDFINFSKQKTLTGKESKKVLKVGDQCKARIIAVSFKDVSNPKIGLTMRQPHLGNVKWLEDEKKKGVKKEKEEKKEKAKK